jgi:hypothetical protein
VSSLEHVRAPHKLGCQERVLAPVYLAQPVVGVEWQEDYTFSGRQRRECLEEGVTRDEDCLAPYEEAFRGVIQIHLPVSDCPELVRGQRPGCFRDGVFRKGAVDERYAQRVFEIG